MNVYEQLRLLIGADEPGAAVRRWTVDYLTGVLDGRTELAAVRHPLGFLCFPAWRGGGAGICVHIWTEDAHAHPTTSPMHAHSWDLISVVLYGAVGNDILELDSAPAHPTHRICEIHSAADGDLVRATSRVCTYRTRSSERFRAGEVYTLPYGAFHLSDVHGEAATVVLGRDRSDTPDRSLGTLATTDHWVHRTTCTAIETRRAAQIVLDRLNNLDHPDNTVSEQLEDRCERAN